MLGIIHPRPRPLLATQRPPRGRARGASQEGAGQGGAWDPPHPALVTSVVTRLQWQEDFRPDPAWTPGSNYLIMTG